MRKFIVSVMLVLTISSVSFAFVPLVIPAWVTASTAVLTVAGAVGVYYGMNPSVKSTVNATSTLSRSSSAVYAVLIANVLSVKTDPVTAKMTFDQASTISQRKDLNNSFLYPKMSAVYFGSEICTLDNTHPGCYLDATAQGRGKWNVGTLIYQYGDSCVATSTVLPSLTPISNGIEVRVFKSVQYCTDIGQKGMKATQYNATAATGPPPPKSRTVIEVNTSLTGGNASGGTLLDNYQAELDKMYQDPTYIPTFTDDTTGLPYVPPAGALSPSALTAANNTAASAAASAAAAAASATAAAAAAAAATTAASVATAAEAAAAAAPSDTALAAAAVDARAASNAAAATAATAAAADAAAAATEADQETVTPESAPGTKKTFSWTRFNTLKNLLGNTFPFSLISTLSGFISPLVRDPVAPAFDLPLYGLNVIHVSLSAFDPAAAVCRWLIGLILTIGAVQLVIAFYRGN